VWKWQTSGNGDVAVLSTVLFLRAWTPARLRTDLSRAASLGEVAPATETVTRRGRLERGHRGRRSSGTGMVARLPTWQMVTARTHEAMRPYHSRS